MLYIDYLLTDAERQAFEAKDLTVGEITVGTRTFHRHGIVFTEDEQDGVFEILNLVASRSSYLDFLETPQGEDTELYEVQLMDMPTAVNPIVWNNTRRCNDDSFRNQLSEFRVGLVIEAHGYGRRAYQHRQNVLFIHLASLPSVVERLEERRYYRSYMIVAQDPLPADHILISDNESQVLAYFKGDAEGGTLWLTYDPSEQRSTQPLDYVLYTVARLMHAELGPVLSYDEFCAIWARRNYVVMARRQLEEEIANINGRIERVDIATAEARRSLTLALRTADMARRRREELHTRDQQELIQEMGAQLDRDLENLAVSPEFESLNFSSDTFTAVTRPIKLRHDGRIYEMGRYEIAVSLIGESLRLTSVDDTYSRGYCHPHISSGGNPCLGNISESVAQLQAQMAFGTLLPYLVRYLEDGYNPADSYVRIENFDVRNYPENEEVQDNADAEPAGSAGGGGRVRRRRHSR